MLPPGQQAWGLFFVRRTTRRPDKKRPRRSRAGANLENYGKLFLNQFQ
jgi:hypothetical protein